MSKFIDELKLISQASPQPMGFKVAPATPPKPKMLLVAALAEADVEPPADYATGANAGLLSITNLSSGAKTIQKIGKAMPEIPWGGWLKDISGEKAKPLVEAGADFVVFPQETPLATLEDIEAGKIIEIGASLSEGLLRTIDDLPVDAVLIGSEPGKDYSLTWRHLMFFQRCSDLLTKPLLATVPSGISVSELQALWSAGIIGVVIESSPEGRISELRQMIDKLTFPLPSKRRKAEPLLPRISEETRTEPEEEPEED